MLDNFRYFDVNAALSRWRVTRSQLPKWHFGVVGKSLAPRQDLWLEHPFEAIRAVAPHRILASLASP
jgi:hypothetical protein